MKKKTTKYSYDISVIIPVYNVEKYLGKCLDSLLEQTYNQDRIEIILINDGSKDNSLEVCKEYSEKYKNIKLIDKKNEGVSVARNTGIKAATGKYIMILDSDDFLSKNSIENLYNFFEKHYDEIDLLTYPIHFFYVNERTELHPRYKAYDKGSGIYDINEYIYLNQSTVNIMFKNEQDVFYDATMKLSEDQKFDTQQIMKKGKIGYCEDAIYFYRRHGGGVSQNINSMIYCFESIMDYNEWLIKTYTKKGVLPKYIQSLIINTINWRLTSNQLIPYQFEGEEYEKAYERIVNLINHVDNDVIIGLSNMSLVVKGYLLKVKKAKFELKVEDNKMMLMVDDLALEEREKFTFELTTYDFADNILRIDGFFNTHIFEMFEPTVKLILTNKDKSIETKECELKYSRWSEKTTKFKAGNLYRTEAEIDTNKTKEIKIIVEIENNEYPVEIKSKPTTTYITESKNRFAVINKKEKIQIKNKNIVNNIKYSLKRRTRYLRSRKNEFLLRNVSMTYFGSKEVWLYMDRKGILDNAYLQFKHDFNKKDGIKRYYVYDEDINNIKDNFTEEELKYLVKFKTVKHRKLFVNCHLLITSFCDEVTYSPFGKNTFRYLDIIKHKLVYLQHGVLHANLQLMYGKEFTRINKFIISSDFEFENLTTNYLYSPKDLIKSGMPRLDEEEKKVKVENKIILAPTWRNYLIGPIANGERGLFKEKFLESTYFKKLNEIIGNKKLIEVLEKNKITLDLKLHPIFKGYKELFTTTSKYINVDCESANLAEYKMFITDFSSFQFDFIKYDRPILYFMPDQLEFKSGLHSYSDLDLKYENAFGDLYLESEEIIERIIKEINGKFKNSKKYSDRMKNFFYKIDSCQEKLYEELKKIK